MVKALGLDIRGCTPKDRRLMSGVVKTEHGDVMRIKIPPTPVIEWESLDEMIELAQGYFEACGDHVGLVELDLQGVANTDSLGLNFIVMLYGNVSHRHGKFRCVNVGERMYTLLDKFGLTERFDVIRDDQES